MSLYFRSLKTCWKASFVGAKNVKSFSRLLRVMSMPVSSSAWQSILNAFVAHTIWSGQKCSIMNLVVSRWGLSKVHYWDTHRHSRYFTFLTKFFVIYLLMLLQLLVAETWESCGYMATKAAQKVTSDRFFKHFIFNIVAFKSSLLVVLCFILSPRKLELLKDFSWEKGGIVVSSFDSVLQ